MKEERARTIYRKNYTPPNYRVTEIGLEFKLYENETIVQSKLKIESLEKDLFKPNPLVLDGEQLELLEIKLDGTSLQSQQYQIETSSLTIPSVPESFDLEIKVRIHPEKNTSLEGLYRSGTMFCTQCEAEGFRRITYFPDRPDVMARYKTRLEADSERYPVLLPTGICSGPKTWKTEDMLPSGRTPSPNRVTSLLWLQEILNVWKTVSPPSRGAKSYSKFMWNQETWNEPIMRCEA